MNKDGFDQMAVGDIIKIPLTGSRSEVSIRVTANARGKVHGWHFKTMIRPKKNPTCVLVKRIS